MNQRPSEVAGTSFALILWDYLQLIKINDDEEVRRLGRRVDLAGMVAQGFHDPSQLKSQEIRYLQAAGMLKPMLEDSRKKLERFVEIHKTLKPVEATDA